MEKSGLSMELEATSANMEEPMDTSAAEGTHLYEMLADVTPGWARLRRKMLDPKAPPAETR